MRRSYVAAVAMLIAARTAQAEPPAASYIFPAGGQRGKTVPVHVGGIFLHKSCAFEMLGPGVEVSPRLQRAKTVWFEGPMLPLPDSQRQEDYPKDMAGQVKIAADALLGTRYWRLSTSQGATPGMKFVVGELPEIVEQEIDGDPLSVEVPLPVTVNGRIFPRAEVDVWSFTAKKGQAVTCEVNAQRLGSPLEAFFQVVDFQGKLLAESEGLVGGDARLRFVAPADGKYQVRIHDINFNGSQSHVYRLTLTADPFVDRLFPLGGKRVAKVEFEVAGQSVPTKVQTTLPVERGPGSWLSLVPRGNQVLLDLDDFEEYLEPQAQASVPSVCNGRIARAGEIDEWKVVLKKGESLEAELRATRLGSPLDGVLSVMDAAGKELGRADTPLPEGDPLLRFTAPADGAYTVRVQDRFRSRGGPAFAYRLRLSKGAEPDFRLRVQASAVTLPRAGKAQLPVVVERLGNFTEPVTLTVEGLPKGVTAKWNEVGKSPGTTINLEADKDAKIQTARVTIKATAKRGTEMLTRSAVVTAPLGQPEIDTVLLAVALPTPFKVVGEYEVQWAGRGGMLKRKFKIERNGFDGPLEIGQTDKQCRHLQGVTGPTIVVPAGATEFEYGVHLPAWMELGRTSRSCVMALGVIKDKDGSLHEVSFSSVNQNEQLVAVVEPGKLSIDLERSSVATAAGKTITLPFKVSRGQGLNGAVVVELVVADHIKGIRAEPITLAKDQSQGTLTLRCDDPMPGPFNMPLTVRATLRDSTQPYVAEAKVEISVEK